MQLCYIDESGTPDVPGNTSHYVLAGLAIPVWKWRSCERSISFIKRSYGLESAELHTAWMLRAYPEQKRITDFDSMSFQQRRAKVKALRTAELLKLQRTNNQALFKQTRKNYKKTEPYIHLTHSERQDSVRQVADCVSRWRFARLFAECIDKVHFDQVFTERTIEEQAFEQIVSRFETCLHVLAMGIKSQSVWGLLIHDNNDTVARKHTELMKRFHDKGTLWTAIRRIIETPLFVNSQLTSMVQIADICGYALRRYVENGEDELFDLIFKRADTKDGIVVGVRHYSDPACKCEICIAHRTKVSVDPSGFISSARAT